jgi:hypothetical protein
VDFSRINDARTNMQTALDSTGLMLSKTAAAQTAAELQTSATTYFNALITSHDLLRPAVSVAYTTTGGSKIVLDAAADVKTDFMNIFGYGKVTVKTTSTAEWGNTNQAIGLQVGWQTLTQSPFTVPAEDPNYKYSKVIILLTDDLNTQDHWYSWASQIDAREQTTCNNIKAGGITIYIVQVNTGGDPTSTLLQGCASSSNKFFLLTSANQLVSAFNQIGTALTNLRLAN